LAPVFAAALPQLANDYGKVNDECWHVPKTKAHNETA